jgi:hypothetical protein
MEFDSPALRSTTMVLEGVKRPLMPKVPPVPKDQFDALLRRLANADPAKRQDIKTEAVKPGKIIPPVPKSQSER